jgi:hypothetical protein
LGEIISHIAREHAQPRP